MRLKGKVAVVTGASDGIGKQIVLKLAAQGTNLALVARSKEDLKKTQKEAEKLGNARVAVYPCDIRDNRQLQKTIERIISDFNRINILINNAGVWQKMMQLDELAEDVVEDVLKTNLASLIQCTRLILPYLRREKEAAIVNISSKSGVTGQKGQSVYSASKWGVRGFTEVLREDLKDSNIRVAGIYQAGINTQLFNKAGDSKVPIHKFTDPADLADVVVYMLSRPAKIWLHEVRVEN